MILRTVGAEFTKVPSKSNIMHFFLVKLIAHGDQINLGSDRVCQSTTESTWPYLQTIDYHSRFDRGHSNWLK